MKCHETVYLRAPHSIYSDRNFWCDVCDDYPEKLVVKQFIREYKYRAHVYRQNIVAWIYIIKCHGSKFVVDDQTDIQRIRKQVLDIVLGPS